MRVMASSMSRELYAVVILPGNRAVDDGMSSSSSSSSSMTFAVAPPNAGDDDDEDDLLAAAAAAALPEHHVFSDAAEAAPPSQRMEAEATEKTARRMTPVTSRVCTVRLFTRSLVASLSSGRRRARAQNKI